MARGKPFVSESLRENDRLFMFSSSCPKLFQCRRDLPSPNPWTELGVAGDLGGVYGWAPPTEQTSGRSSKTQMVQTAAQNPTNLLPPCCQPSKPREIRKAP